MAVVRLTALGYHTIIDTLARIRREVFSDTKNGATGHLQNVIDKRFGIRPDGYFYSPIASGGLELRNVMPEVLASAKDNKRESCS